MVKAFFISAFVFSGTALCVAAPMAAVSPYTFTGRIMDARHSAFDTNRVAVIEVSDASGKSLARAKTGFNADSRRNYAVSVPMATSTLDRYAVQGSAVIVSVTDDLGKRWSGVVVDASVGVAGGVREVDIVLGADANGDGSYTYDVAARPKYTQSVPHEKYSVTKLWQDAGHQEIRPKAVTVKIYRDGVLRRRAHGGGKPLHFYRSRNGCAPQRVRHEPRGCRRGAGCLG